MLSFLTAPLLLVAYVICIYRARHPIDQDWPHGVGGKTDRSPPPGVTSDGRECLHVGESATYCTQCWMNLYEERPPRRRPAAPGEAAGRHTELAGDGGTDE
jgi:hypothetical protein